MKVKFLIFFSILFVLISCKTGEVKKTETADKVSETPAKNNVNDVKIEQTEATTDPVVNDNGTISLFWSLKVGIMLLVIKIKNI